MTDSATAVRPLRGAGQAFGVQFRSTFAKPIKICKLRRKQGFTRRSHIRLGASYEFRRITPFTPRPHIASCLSYKKRRITPRSESCHPFLLTVPNAGLPPRGPRRPPPTVCPRNRHFLLTVPLRYKSNFGRFLRRGPRSQAASATRTPELPPFTRRTTVQLGRSYKNLRITPFGPPPPASHFTNSLRRCASPRRFSYRPPGPARG